MRWLVASADYVKRQVLTMFATWSALRPIHNSAVGMFASLTDGWAVQVP